MGKLLAQEYQKMHHNLSLTARACTCIDWAYAIVTPKDFPGLSL